MRIGRLETHARLIDHRWPPLWIGPWVGVSIRPKPEQHRGQAPHMFDAHAQLHLQPDEGLNGVQTGLALVVYRRDGRHRIRFARNWWSPRYGRRPLGWGWWVEDDPNQDWRDDYPSNAGSVFG